jgi:hypothetical protein
LSVVDPDFPQVFFAVTMGSIVLGQTAATCFQALASSRGAAFVVFQTIDQVWRSWVLSKFKVRLPKFNLFGIVLTDQTFFIENQYAMCDLTNKDK